MINKQKMIGGSLWQWWYRHMCLLSGTHTKKHNLQQTTNKEQNVYKKRDSLCLRCWVVCTKEMSVLFVLFFNAVFALTERSICRETSLTLGTPQSTALTVHGWMTPKKMFCLPHFPTCSSLKATQLSKITISEKCIRWKLNGLLQLSLIWNQNREAYVMVILWFTWEWESLRDGYSLICMRVTCNNCNNNVHLSCAHQRPEHSHDTY